MSETQSKSWNTNHIARLRRRGCSSVTKAGFIGRRGNSGKNSGLFSIECTLPRLHCGLSLKTGGDGVKRLALFNSSLVLVLATLSACKDKKPVPAATATPAAAAEAVPEEVAPEAVAALKEMSDYLSKLPKFELTSDTT